MPFTVFVAGGVAKALKRFPATDRERILLALRDFEIDPWHGDVAKIAGEPNLWRRRVGSYRIFYSVDTALYLITVKSVVRRTSSTY